MKGFCIAALGATAIAAMELPIDDIAKLGVSGSCLLLVWWMVARTLPGMSAIQTEALKNLTDAYRLSVADLRSLHHETTQRIVDSQVEATNVLGTHLDGVKDMIAEAAKGEAALLRELIRDKTK